MTNKIIIINIFFVTSIHFLESVQENKLGTSGVKDSSVFRVTTLLETVNTEAIVRRCSIKKVFLEISQISQVFSYEICEISKIAFSYRTPSVAVSVNMKKGA